MLKSSVKYGKLFEYEQNEAGRIIKGDRAECHSLKVYKFVIKKRYRGLEASLKFEIKGQMTHNIPMWILKKYTLHKILNSK